MKFAGSSSLAPGHTGNEQPVGATSVSTSQLASSSVPPTDFEDSTVAPAATAAPASSTKEKKEKKKSDKSKKKSSPSKSEEGKEKSKKSGKHHHNQQTTQASQQSDSVDKGNLFSYKITPQKKDLTLFCL